MPSRSSDRPLALPSKYMLKLAQPVITPFGTTGELHTKTSSSRPDRPDTEKSPSTSSPPDPRPTRLPSKYRLQVHAVAGPKLPTQRIKSSSCIPETPGTVGLSRVETRRLPSGKKSNASTSSPLLSPNPTSEPSKYHHHSPA